MADDITLTVRVRDLSRDNLNRLQGNLNRLRQSLDGANRSTATQGRNAQNATRDLRQLTNQLNRAASSGRLTRSQLDGMNNSLTTLSRTMRRGLFRRELGLSAFRSATREVGVLRARLMLLGRDGNIVSRLGARFLLLGNRIRESGNNANGVRRHMMGFGSSVVASMGRAVGAVGLLLAGMRRLGHVININKRWTAILLAVLLLLGPAAQALGALLIAALGGAFIALGALALKNSEAVKRAFKDMKSSVAADVKAAAQPMEQDLIFGIRQVSAAVSEMRPALTQAFRGVGPLIEDFAGAFTDLAKMSLPGIVSAFDRMGPAMEGFRTAMGMVGQGFGDMFAAMTAGGGAEALKSVWITIGVELKNLLVGIGEFINKMSQSEGATLLLIGVFRTLSGALNVVSTAMSLVDTTFGGLLGHVTSGITGLSSLTELGDGLADSFAYQGKSAGELKKELAAVDAKIKDIKKDTEGKWYEFGLDDVGEQDRRGLDTLEAKRAALTAAIAIAEANAADKTNQHATAVKTLAAALEDLNSKNLTRFDKQAAMEKSIDAAIKKAKELTGKVEFSPSGLLNVDTAAGQAAQEIMGAIARDTADYVQSLKDAKAPQEEIDAAWKRGREQLIGLHDELGVSKTALQAYADQVLATPESVKTKLEVEKEQAEKAVAAAIKKIKEVPDKEKSTVVLEAHRAMERAAQTESAINKLDGRVATVTITVNHFSTNTIRTIREYQDRYLQGRSQHDIVKATGGLIQGFADGGGPVSGPGSSLSDSIPAMLSNGEFVMRASAVQKYGANFLDMLNNGMLNLPRFAKGGKVSKAYKERARDERQARNEARSELTISHFGKMAGFKTDEFKHDLGGFADSLREIVGSLNHWRSVIKKTTHGGLEKSLLRQLDRAGKSLIKYQRAHDKVEKSLEKAKDKLSDLRQEASSLRDSVRGGIMSSTDITRNSGDDKVITMSDIMSRMREGVDKSTAFAGALRDLKKKGVSKEIIRQIAEAGIEGGGMETAGAILSADSSEIQHMNEMQKKINDSAKAAGKTAADAMFGAGLKAAEGLVKGLTKKQKSIEKAMMRIAKAMEKAIKRALKIHSPSRVMEDVGHFTAEGFAVGMQKNRSVDTAWASMLNASPSGSGAAAAGSGGSSGGPQIIQLCLDGKVLDEVILDSNRRTVRTRGGNVQRVYGTRTS